LLGQLTVDFEAGGAYESAATGGDWIEGRGGSDAIQGSAGNDTLYGGSSQGSTADAGDSFLFSASGNGIDEIRDFAFGDRILVRSQVAAGTVGAGEGSN